MKTIRTVLATFGMTTLLYGAFALFCVSIDPAFTARSIYQLFRDTGFPFLVVGIACLLSVLIISFAIAAFRDDSKARRGTAAVDEAKRSGERIVAEARIKADGMIRQAESQIELSQKKAEAEIKREIADVSTKLAEKLIERELDADAHRELIDSFIDKMGDKA